MKPPEQNPPPIVLIKPIKHPINNRQQSNQTNINNNNNKGDTKEQKRIEFKEIPKSFFSYRHISLRDYLTSEMARGKIINNKNNYLKAFSLFKQFKPESLQVNSNTLTLPTQNRVYRNSFPNQNIPNMNKNNNNASSLNKTTAKTKEQNFVQQHTQQLLPQQTKKKFICIGGYADIIENLTARGWEQNKDPKSSDFDFIWTLKTIDINYTNLRKEQIAGHFLRNGAITRKNGLCKNIKNLYFKGIDPNNFFPRCYDLSNISDYNDFIEDFKTNKAICILKKVALELNRTPRNDDDKSVFTKEMINIAIGIVKRKLHIITGDYEHVGISQVRTFVNLISDKEWDIISEEEPLQKQGVYDGKKNKLNPIQQRQDLANKQQTGSIRSQSEITKNLKHMPTSHANTKNTKQSKQKDKVYPLLKDLSQYQQRISSILSELEKHQTQYKMNGIHNIWIVKPGNLSRGRGIHCVNKLNTVVTQCKENNYIIIQKYIENPLIILNRKFDIRQWVLVTNINPLTLWMWEQPYLRFGAEDYKLTDINNLYSHLTNNSIAKYSEHFKETKIEGNMWEVPSFIEHMQSVYNKGDIWNDLHEKMKKIVISSFDSARHEMKQRENSFELFGYDFMIDEQFNVILIEVNSSPALDYSTNVTKKLVKLMIKDLIQVVIDNRDKLSQTKKIGEWTKIYQGQEVDSSYTPNTIGL